jgi:hypothetical protein
MMRPEASIFAILKASPSIRMAASGVVAKPGRSIALILMAAMCDKWPRPAASCWELLFRRTADGRILKAGNAVPNDL